MASCAVIARGEPEYPSSLEDLQQPPRVLYSLGDHRARTLRQDRTVSIVGTRDATPYGVRVAGDLGAAFARAGVSVVSGLARGVDAAVHRGVLDARGYTVAVLGTGADVPYPVSHRSLHAEIAARGLVLSESEPGAPAYKGCFPRRNRIIAALASLTIVVEAPHKSGAINTATHALDLGRTVAAVPGPIDSPRSAGSNQLLRDGAQFIGSIADALTLLGLSEQLDSRTGTSGELERVALAALEQSGALTVDALCDRLGWAPRAALESLGRLELAGLVRPRPDGSFSAGRAGRE